MYILAFNRDGSRFFGKGFKLASELGGTWDGETMVLKIEESLLLNSYERLSPLFEIVRNWSSLRATFRGLQVHPFRFILVMHYISECAGKRSSDPEHCRIYPKVKGWGCKRLSKVQYHVFGHGNYVLNDRFWYNFGHFNGKNEWVIDKEALFQRLYNYAEAKGLTLCPFFDADKLEKALDDLPDLIVPDGKDYRVHYELEYYKGEKVKVPVNIRHIHNPSDRIAQSKMGVADSFDRNGIYPTCDPINMRMKIPPNSRHWLWFSKN